MGNLEKLLVVGVLVVVIAILAISLFWTSDVSTLPEIGKDTVATDTASKTNPVGDVGLPGEALSTVSKTNAADPKAPVVDPNASKTADPKVGVTPLLMSNEPAATPSGATPAVSNSGDEHFTSYTIKSGDTLEVIAQRELGSKKKVSEILKANEGLDPKKLKIGKTILIPKDAGAPTNIMTKSAEEKTVTAPKETKKDTAAPLEPTGRTEKATSYTVQKGDTLWKISKKLYGDGSKWKKLLEGNKDKLSNENALKVGMTLSVP